MTTYTEHARGGKWHKMKRLKNQPAGSYDDTHFRYHRIIETRLHTQCQRPRAHAPTEFVRPPGRDDVADLRALLEGLNAVQLAASAYEERGGPQLLLLRDEELRIVELANKSVFIGLWQVVSDYDRAIVGQPEPAYVECPVVYPA